MIISMAMSAAAMRVAKPSNRKIPPTNSAIVTTHARARPV